MAEGLNAQLSDAYLIHAIRLERFTSGVRKEIVTILRGLERSLRMDLADVDPNGVALTSFKRLRLTKLLDQTAETIKLSKKDILKVMRTNLNGLSEAESQFVLNSINKIIRVDLASVSVSPERLKAIASDVMFSGTPMDEYWERFESKIQAKVADNMREGILRGETNDELVRRISGITEESGVDADALVRTSVQAVSNAARLETYDENDDVIGLLQQRSTLDSRTTDICKAYSGKVWKNDAPDYTPVGHDLPFNGGCPRHVRCRSTIMPITKGWDELGALRTGGRPTDDPEAYFATRLEAQGLNASEIESAVIKAQASMDGQVPKDLDYEAWLKTKSAAFQEDILGPTKYRLWKAGKINFRDLVDQSGDPLSLEELLKEIGEL